ncbi:MAG: tetratricopeptide repeat protein [Acidobacteriota bacterium]
MTDQPTPQEELDGGGLRELLETRPQTARVIGVLIIVVLTMLAYVPAMTGLFIWEDDQHVVDNPLLRDWEGLARIWTDVFPNPANYPLPQYYPLTQTTFWLQYQLGGHSADGVPLPMPFHVTNVVLHVCSALLLWFLLARLRVPGAWLAAALFAIHPIQAETVSWISERKNCLAVFFFLSSLYVYLRYAGVIELAAPEPGKERVLELPSDPGRLFALATILFLCALWSKTISASMPAVALVIIWWKRGLSLNDLKGASPLLLVGGAMAGLTGYIEHVRIATFQRPQDFDLAPTFAGEIGARLILAGEVVWFYVWKLLVPVSLSFNYLRWTIDPGNLALYLIPLSVIAVLVALLALSPKIGKGPAAAAIIFVGTLIPAMCLVNVRPMQYAFVADRFVYLSSFAFFALVAAVLWKNLTLEGFSGMTVCALLVLSAMSWGRATTMSVPLALWKDTGNKSWFALNNYGTLIRDFDIIEDFNARMGEAEKVLLKVIELKPDHAEARVNLAVIAERRGLVSQLELQSTTQATTQQTTRIATSRPTTQAQEYFAVALNYYREAIALQPNLIAAHYGMANLLGILGRRQEAVEHYRECVRIYPRHAAALQVLADYSLATGRANEAVAYFETLVDLFPRSPRVHADYGWALLQAGNIVGGFAEWEVTLGMSPEDPRYANEFGIKMAAAQDFRRAFEYFRIAYNIDPGSIEAITNLGVVAARLGQPAQARTLLNEALKRDANFAPAKLALENLEAGRLGPATTQASTTLPATNPTTATNTSQ